MFKLILESYENIKIEKGLSVKKPLIRRVEEPEDNFKSKRPNSQQYEEDFAKEKSKFGDFDSAEFYYRSKGEEKYARFTDSFREIYETKSTEFKPLQGELKNTLLRFKLDELKAVTKQVFPENDSLKISVAMVGFVGCLIYAFNRSAKDLDSDNEKALEKSTANINMAKVFIDKKTAMRDSTDDYLQQNDNSIDTFFKDNPNMSQEERMMIKLLPDTDILIPK